VINRATVAQKLKFRYELFSKQKISYKHYSLSLPDGADSDVDNDNFIVDLDPKTRTDEFSDDGYIYLDLPASSVSSIVMQATR